MLGAVIVVATVAPPRLAGDGLGLRRFLVPEVSEEAQIGQRFIMNAPDLEAVEVRAAPVAPVVGAFRFTLREGSRPEVLRQADVAAADLVRRDSYVFRFARVELSRDRPFEFTIAPVPGNPGRGVALWATRGARVSQGGLTINGTLRWASLAFQTHTPAVSPLLALFTAGDPERPPRWLIAAGLIGSWISLRFVLREVVRLQSAASEG
jgi:hypothetical protein